MPSTKSSVYEWKYGEKTLLAQKAGISRQFLGDILSRRRPCPPALAPVLETACTTISSRNRHRSFPKVDRMQWLYPDEFENPLLFIDEEGEDEELFGDDK